MNKLIYNGQEIIDFDELADKYTREEVDNLVSTVFKYKGTVATVDDLNNIVEKAIGDCYNVEASGQNYAWNGEEWSPLSGTVDLTNYYTKQQIDGKFGSYLAKNNTTEYTPTEPFHPATKQYVDNNSGGGSGGGVYYHDNASGEPTYINTLEEGTHIFRSKGLYLVASEELYNTSGKTAYTPLLDGTVYVTEKYDNVADGEYFSYIVVENGGLRGLTKDLSNTTGFKLNSLHDSYIDFLRANADKVINSKFTFNNLPQCSKVPTDDKHFANKKYIDNTVSSNVNSLKSELMNEINEISNEINAGSDSDTIYLPFEEGFRFWSESTAILSDVFNAAVTEYVNSFKHYTTDIRVKTDDANQFFSGVPVDIQFYNAGGLMATRDGYVILRDDDDTYAAMGNNTILQTADKKYYLASRVSNGTWYYDSNNVFTGSKEVYLVGNDRYLNAITYVLKLTLNFSEGNDIVCSESYLWKYKNGLTENFMLYGDKLNITTAEDVCQDILDRYLTNPSIDQYIINEHIKNFYIKTRNRYVKGLTGYYNTLGVTDPANVVFENTDPTKLNSFALTNDGEFHITYNEDYVTGVYNDIDVAPGYDIDYNKLNKVIQKARPDNIDRPIPIVLTRTIGDRTVTYEVQATVGYVTTVSIDGTKSKQLNLTFIVVDDGVVLRFYGSGAIDVNATELYNDLLTEDIHCWSDDYNG